jgi:hypothetical protein
MGPNVILVSLLTLEAFLGVSPRRVALAQLGSLAC